MSDTLPFLPDPELTMEVTPQTVATWFHLPFDQRPRLVDCREADELGIGKIAGHEWFPLGNIPQFGNKFASEDPRGIVVYCHHGMRSLRAVSIMRAYGVKHAFSMSGGIDAWSRLIDPTVARY